MDLHNLNESTQDGAAVMREHTDEIGSQQNLQTSTNEELPLGKKTCPRSLEIHYAHSSKAEFLHSSQFSCTHVLLATKRYKNGTGRISNRLRLQ